MTLAKLADYGKEFQLKVIGALLTDKTFILNIRDIIKEEYWDSDAHKWIINQIIEYFDKYHTTITATVLKVELKKVKNDILRIALREELKHSYEATTQDLTYVQEEFTAFCKNQEMKLAILSSADLLEKGDYDGIRSLIEKAMKAGMDKSIGHEYNRDIEARYREDARLAIPTPWPEINELTQGGFGPGDLVIMFGNPGGGKSWIMVAIGAHAAKLGYNVNYYTLELGEDYVGKRFDCNLTGYGIDIIKDNREEVSKTVDNIKGNIIIKEYAPKMASIHTIEAHIQKCTDMGFKPDLVIIDYLDYLKPPSRGRVGERKDDIDDNYIAAKGLAKKLKIPVISPSQVNRAGAKDDIIEGDKAAGSYDKIMVSDISISLSRKKEDKILKTGRIHFIKNRYGDDGMTYSVSMDTNNGHIEFGEKHLIDSSNPEEKKPYAALAEKFFSQKSLPS